MVRGLEPAASRFTTLTAVLFQGFKFGIVGIAATLVHVSAFVLWIEVLELRALWANLAAFALAVLVSFWGHFHWTFERETARGQSRYGRAFSRFVFVAILGLGLNSLAVYLIVDVFDASYLYAVALMLTAVPAFVFAFSKFWAFA
jgi:putative flippase GtrA